MTDARIALGADGALAAFNEAGILGAADVHVARRLARIAGVDIAADVVVTVALTVRAVRAGSVCVDVQRLREIPPDVETPSDSTSIADLDTLPWPDPATIADTIRSSPLTSTSESSPLQPLRMAVADDGTTLLYLDRYFRQEQKVREILAERATRIPSADPTRIVELLADLFGDQSDGAQSDGDRNDSDVPDLQRAAAAVAALRYSTVVAGGPGTGKTHTAARIIALLSALHGPGIRVGLCAPTGRAAASMQSAVAAQAERLSLPSVEAVTIHRLLGSRGVGHRFRHHAGHRLPHDAVIVDEASMVSLTLMHHLLDALRPHARLILIGDPDQLASVDAGAVLADLVGRTHTGPLHHSLAEVIAASPTTRELTDDAEQSSELADGVVRLRRRRRFGAAIGALADAVRAGAADDAVAICEGSDPEVTLLDPDDLSQMRSDVLAWAASMSAAARRGDATAALEAIGMHRVLCAHREGPAGVTAWTRQVISWVTDELGVVGDPDRVWYPGRPVLLTETDHQERLYNGDTGVIIDRGDRPAAAFGRGSEIKLIHPGRLRGAVGAYAMTIHRSQGSQYGAVSVVVPPADSVLLTRELLYTAITRATDRVRLVGTAEGLRAGIERKVLRASGLRTGITEG